MAVRVKVDVATGYVMPAVCCACGQPSAAGTLLEIVTDAASRTSIALHFPLCDECGLVARSTSGWRGEAGADHCAPESKERFTRMDGSVRLSDYRPLAERDAQRMTIEFTNEIFAAMFEKANVRPLDR